MRRRLYQESLRLFRERGYERTTLRDIGRSAAVSPALLYRYFPGKHAILLALYDDLSADFHERASAMPGGHWRERFMFALRTSLAVLGPQRPTIAALVPMLVGGGGDGVFAESTAFSRRRVQAVFEEAVAGATDAPKRDDARAVGRLLYLAHLLVLLWWALDKSPEQRATKVLLAVVTSLLPPLGLALRLRRVRRLARSVDDALREGLIGESASAFAPPAGDAATPFRTSRFK